MALQGQGKKKDGFHCVNCSKFVKKDGHIGTRHRNHCPFCLYSKHVDLNTDGDRKAPCKGKMIPIGLTLKNEGEDKYGRERIGELMLVHECSNQGCKKVSINRIAGDDDEESVLRIYTDSLKLDDKQKEDFISKHGITILDKEDEDIVRTQLFGNNETDI